MRWSRRSPRRPSGRSKSIIGDRAFLKSLKPAEFADAAFGIPTVTDILAELEKPGRDPRPEFKTATFQEGVDKIADLKPGMQLEGVVTNVAAFGAFVDVGVHQDGLVHISELSDRFVKDPREVVKAGDVVKVRVKDVDVARKRIALTMKSGAIDASAGARRSIAGVRADAAQQRAASASDVGAAGRKRARRRPAPRARAKIAQEVPELRSGTPASPGRRGRPGNRRPNLDCGLLVSQLTGSRHISLSVIRVEFWTRGACGAPAGLRGRLPQAGPRSSASRSRGVEERARRAGQCRHQRGEVRRTRPGRLKRVRNSLRDAQLAPVQAIARRAKVTRVDRDLGIRAGVQLDVSDSWYRCVLSRGFAPLSGRLCSN